jgi:hypothetical protein
MPILKGRPTGLMAPKIVFLINEWGKELLHKKFVFLGGKIILVVIREGQF